jgi:hypothetical protein
MGDCCCTLLLYGGPAPLTKISVQGSELVWS